ncbi:MAG: hypothetical protein MUE61_15145 [Vicinamibacterales bacterium]|jgi:hypothetical protein|nr:hypothetical protein [Vicinamibacterales bacterium]
MNGNNGHLERHSVDEAQLDVTIDAVARGMTAFEPSGALRARVLERIEQGRRHHSSPAVPRWAWAGAAAALVLAVATAVWVARPVPATDGAQTTVAERRSGAPSLAAAGAERPVAPSAVSPGTASPGGGLSATPQTRRPAAARGVQTAEADVVQDQHPVPALAEIEPLRFSAVEPHPLQIAAVEVTPLPAMLAIEIPSLGPGLNDIQSADPKKEK